VTEQVVHVPYCPHPGQRKVHDCQARFRVLACGARWGKDRCTVNELFRQVVTMASEPHRDGLIPRVLAWYVAPSFPMARQMWAELKYFIPASLRNVREAEKAIEMPGGIVIEVKSADNPNALVARGLDFVAVTESAMVSEEAWEMALRPRLASPGRGPGGQGGLALLNGTPKGRNWFWRAWMRGQDPLVPEWRSWQWRTEDNPHIRPEEIEAARRDMPDRWFRQEFLAEFLDDAGGVFRGVRRLLVAVDSWPPQRVTGRRYVVGVDWARHYDWTVVVVLDVTDPQRWVLVDFDRFNGLDYQVQLGRLKVILERWRPSRVVVEQNSIGDPLATQLQRDVPYSVTPFTTTATSKRQLVEAMALRVEQGGLALPARQIGQSLDPLVPVLVNELEAFEYTVTRAGNVTYAAPGGLHDDCVMALVLAGHAGDGAGGVIVPRLVPGTNWRRRLGI
jgi:hypothetical protein